MCQCGRSPDERDRCAVEHRHLLLSNGICVARSAPHNHQKARKNEKKERERERPGHAYPFTGAPLSLPEPSTMAKRDGGAFACHTRARREDGRWARPNPCPRGLASRRWTTSRRRAPPAAIAPRARRRGDDEARPSRRAHGRGCARDRGAVGIRALSEGKEHKRRAPQSTDRASCSPFLERRRSFAVLRKQCRRHGVSPAWVAHREISPCGLRRPRRSIEVANTTRLRRFWPGRLGVVDSPEAGSRRWTPALFSA